MEKNEGKIEEQKIRVKQHTHQWFHFSWSDVPSFPFPLKQAVNFLSQLTVQGAVRMKVWLGFAVSLSISV